MVSEDKFTDQQKEILLNKGTEPPFSGDLLYNEEYGTYKCVQCGAE